MPRTYTIKTDRVNIDERIMKLAIRKCLAKRLKVKEVARQYGIKRTTLQPRIKRKKSLGEVPRNDDDSGNESEDDAPKFNSKYTAKQVFTREQELELSEYIKKSSNLHYGLSYKQIRVLAYEFAKSIPNCKMPENWTKNKKQERNLMFRVTMNEEQLQGKNRFVSDGLASIKDCRFLIAMAKQFAKIGDGYDGKQSPHTKMEKLEGITLGRILFLTYFGLLHPNYIRLYLRVTEDVKKHVQDYFQIKEKMYFSYTQLVCRTAISDSSEIRTDFSHKIHADNCNILKNGTCMKSNPAFIWRSHSAILYLNDDFEGGEFIFSSDEAGSKLQSTIKPICGRMIAFSSGAENLHGVKAVRKGSRCALGIWFTHDPLFEENDRNLAWHVVENDSNFHSDSSNIYF